MGENIENALMGLLAVVGIGILRKEFLDLVLVRELNLAEPAYKRKVERKKKVLETKKCGRGLMNNKEKTIVDARFFFLKFAVFFYPWCQSQCSTDRARRSKHH